MADPNIEDSTWSEASASNTSAVPGGIPALSAPSAVYQMFRATLMAALKKDWNRRNPTVTSGGSANAQTLTYGVAPSAYVKGQPYSFKAGFTNTGSTTLNVNGLGTKNIFMDGAACVGGEIQLGQVVQVMYDGTQFQIVSGRPQANIQYGFRNLLYNGGFEVWQRGAGGAASIAIAASSQVYTADRWFLTTFGSQACTVSQVAGLTSASRWAAKVQRNNLQTGVNILAFEQTLPLEQIYSCRGLATSVSFTAKAGANFSAASGAMSCQIFYGTGAAGKRGQTPFSGETGNAATTQNLTTTPTYYSGSGGVMPTNTTQACIQFFFTPVGTAGADDSFTIDDVQLEACGVPTAFERRPFETELKQCQWVYRKSFQYSVAPAQNIASTAGAAFVQLPTGASGTFGLQIPFSAVMRVAPTITTYNPSAANANWRDSTGAADRVVTQSNIFDGGFDLTGAAGVAGSANRIHWQADADL